MELLRKSYCYLVLILLILVLLPLRLLFGFLFVFIDPENFNEVCGKFEKDLCKVVEDYMKNC